MKDKWTKVILVIAGIVLVGQLVMTWTFMIWTWNKQWQHERALIQHAQVLQQLIQEEQKGGEK